MLVTSRRRLATLITAHGARPPALDGLSNAEAGTCWRRIGADRVAGEPDAVTASVDGGAGLRLALAVLAARRGRAR